MTEDEQALYVKLMMELIYCILGREFVGQDFSQIDFLLSEQEYAFLLIVDSGVAIEKNDRSFVINKTDNDCREYFSNDCPKGRFTLNQLIPIFVGTKSVDNNYASWPDTVEPFVVPSVYKNIVTYFIASGFARLLDEVRLQWTEKYVNLYRLGYGLGNDDLIKTAQIMPIADDQKGVELRQKWVNTIFG